MKYAIANKKVIQKLGAKGIFIDHPFNKTFEKHSIYELTKNDTLYVNSYSWYMSYFWVNRDYLKQFNIKIVEMVDDEIFIYDYPEINVDFDDFLDTKKENITSIYTTRDYIKEFLKDIYEIDKNGVNIDSEFKPYILNKDVMRIINEIALNKKDKKEYIDYLLSSKLSLINPYAILASVYLKKNNLVAKKVAFYSFSCAYRGHMITDELLKKSDGVFLYAKKCNDKYEKLKEAYYLPEHLISCMDNFRVIIYSSLTSILPSKPKKIYIQHDIFDSPFGYAERVIKLKNKTILTPLLEMTDIICVANKYIKNKYQPLFELAFVNDKTHILGYMKFDFLLKRKIKKEKNYIIYAPSLLDKKCFKYHSLPYFGEKLIEKLLKTDKVVFRPHPQNYNHPIVAKIVAKFKHHTNFIYDNNANDYLYYYTNSKFLISDISGTAYTYTFLTNNPVLFLSPNEKFIKKDLGDLKFFEYRKKIGEVIFDLANLDKTITHLIKKKPIYKLNIQKLKQKLIYNIGKSEEELLKLIKEIDEN
ncbi:MAG: hypothetical protein GXO40_02085 [Epsilonproteobacteria bacterium]|nr:hypothetical protein [Campylobacterota bacterium]